MPSAIELVRKVRNLLDRVVKVEWHGEGWSMVEGLDAALVEMERDQAFFKAAEALGAHLEDYDLWSRLPTAYASDARYSRAFEAAYRARREERGKHGEVP